MPDLNPLETPQLAEESLDAVPDLSVRVIVRDVAYQISILSLPVCLLLDDASTPWSSSTFDFDIPWKEWPHPAFKLIARS
jgi:hypothetical protein